MVKIYLQSMRIKKGFSVRELARISGVSKSYISEIEHGERMPTIDIICKLARALKCSPCELFICK